MEGEGVVHIASLNQLAVLPEADVLEMLISVIYAVLHASQSLG